MTENYSQYRIWDIERNLQHMGIRPLDIAITGVTGAGKSTTLNSFFQRAVTTVGDGVDPQTMEIAHYSLNQSFRLWDTPGLGDGIERDKSHKKSIINLLERIYESGCKGYKFIDMVLVIIEGANRDMGTTYTLLNDVIIPHIQSDRILVAINQADFAMKGHHWVSESNRPDAVLLDFLTEQAQSIKRRIYESTGVSIHQPIFYSAKYGYNVDKLFDFIIDHMPKERQLI